MDTAQHSTVTPEQPVPSTEPIVEAAPAPDATEALSQAEAKIAELENTLKDTALRAQAEAQNLRRRAQEDVAKASKFAMEKFARELLAVKDSLEMALTVENASVDTLRDGVELTLKQLVAAFEKAQLVEVNPMGEKLDPNRHQAISMVPAEAEPNTVVQVMQKGYLLADRVLRPAMVMVAAPK